MRDKQAARELAANATDYPRSWFQRTTYALFRIFSRQVGVHYFDLHTNGREMLPERGGGLILSTHQSVLDPVLIGLICNRRLNYLARKTLFRKKLFAAAIRHLDAIEIDREGGGIEGLKESLKRLRRGELVLMFPEGTRTEDGEVQSVKPGFISLARRSRVPIIPIAIVGAWEALPRGTKFPLSRPIKIVVGKPITPLDVEPLDDEGLRVLLQSRLEECHDRGKVIRA